MKLKSYLPYFIAVVVFTLVALSYFYPVLSGKQILQSDIVQFTGMSHEVVQYRDKFHSEPYWTDAAFGGMPTYQLSAYYPLNYIQKLDQVLRFLPRPADYLFLYFLGFFVLLMVLKVDWKLAIFGAIAFGFSTYFIIILGVGHNAKALAIAYMPLVLAGVLLIFNKNYLKGFILTTFALALEIAASHIQMTYYLSFVLMFIALVYLYQAIKSKEFAIYFKQIAFLVLASFIAIGVNATPLMATSQYAKHSTRGKSELTINPDGKKIATTNGLDPNYITQYSYSPLETFNLLIPRFMGGGSHEALDTDSNTYKFLADKAGPAQAKQFAQSAPLYWGAQPIVAAPAYIGAVLIFLAFMGILLLKSKHKIWLITAICFAILLSWGKNLSLLTDLFIKYIPLYNKFRAVSSIQVIVELCVPILALLGCSKFLSQEVNSDEKIKSLKNAGLVLGGLLLVFVLFGTSLFSFEGLNDGYYAKLLSGLDNALIADRKAVFFNDSLRSLALILLVFGTLWGFLKSKISQSITVVIIGILMVLDLVLVDWNYVNATNFVSAKQVKQPIKATEIDQRILLDTSHYRVANFSVDPMNDGTTSYYHLSVGGYHAAKPGRYQDLYDFQISKNNIEVLNMLNTKYLIFPNDNKVDVQLNPNASGAAWFVKSLKFVEDANQEILALTTFVAKDTAIINHNEFPAAKTDFQNFESDSTAQINLMLYQPNHLEYQSQSSKTQLAVFSEMYYKDGWIATIDGTETPIYRANYVLRALKIPAGNHQIIFKFKPQVIQTGTMITATSFALWLLIMVGWVIYHKKKQPSF